jgi:hypothetical protein
MGYAGHIASLGATHAHNDDDIIAVAVQPGCSILRMPAKDVSCVPGFMSPRS